ncbi:MAG: T9SS type A sorting domain-containing protein [Candidatus Hatepunaea meridiana]|nr:T9SS type A sorting domain-containing protein [Candidatus Hatepunaea meridiana]
MKQFNLHLYLFLLIMSCGALADTTHVGGRVSGRFTLEGSPYIVDQGLLINEGDTLIIDAGVEILFDEYGDLWCRGTLLANGTVDDSILFDTYTEDYWCTIFLYSEGTPLLSHCILRNTTDEMDDDEEPYAIRASGSFVIENCFFDNLPYSVRAFGEDIIIRGCRFTGGAGLLVGWYGPLIEQCIFEETGIQIAGWDPDSGGVTVNNCVFNGYISTVSLSFSVKNSIFSSGGISWYPMNPFESDIRPEIEYNTFNDGSELYLRNQYAPDCYIAGFDTLDRVNANGDSTDRYGNLFMDPQLIGGDDFRDQYFLSDDSPCIDAGDPESAPDPDGTRADIGAFHFHQRDIELASDTLLFETPGSLDSAAITICNIGLTTLTITAQSITPGDSHFSIGNGNGEFVIESESEHTTCILFAPDEAGEYEAVLHIESDDPDEEEVEVLLIGTALGVGLSDEALPTEFSITGIYPNPFNSNITITYSVPVIAQTSLVIYDISGRKAATLVDSKTEPGIHKTTFNANNLATGIYFVRMTALDVVQTRKVMLIR